MTVEHHVVNVITTDHIKVVDAEKKLNFITFIEDKCSEEMNVNNISTSLYLIHKKYD